MSSFYLRDGEPESGDSAITESMDMFYWSLRLELSAKHSVMTTSGW